MASEKFLLIASIFFALTLDVKAFPRKPRQNDDDDSTTPSAVGLNVAQIILGALTGNIDSIVKASFGFIENSSVNKLSHNTWETLKGNPTETPPWLTTTKKPVLLPEDSEDDPESVRPTQQPQTINIQPVQSAQVAGTSLQQTIALAPSDAYSQGFPAQPTSSPVRTTQPTYVTLAPLSVIIEKASTTVSSDTDDEDVDEAEGENGLKGRIRLKEASLKQ